jgi:hypothetical protein
VFSFSSAVTMFHVREIEAYSAVGGMGCNVRIQCYDYQSIT